MNCRARSRRERAFRLAAQDIEAKQTRLDSLYASLCAAYRTAGLPVPDVFGDPARGSHLSLVTP